jgi:hypothetical protein
VRCNAGAEDALALALGRGGVAAGEGRADEEDAAAAECRPDDVHPAAPSTTPAPTASTPRLLMDVIPPVCAPEAAGAPPEP